MGKWFKVKTPLERNLEKIVPGGRAMILAYDQGFEHGPRDFLSNPKSADFEYILEIAKKGGFTALVVHLGLAEKYNKQILDSGVPLIVKLNGKSELYTLEDSFSPQLYLVEQAAHLGASAVGYTVYSGSKYENQMNREFAQIIRIAHEPGIGLPAIGWMYPRGESLRIPKACGGSATSEKALQEIDKAPGKPDIDEMPSMVAYGARVGLELGADIVKVKYTGSVETFRWVVKCAHPTKVMLAGGLKDTEKFFRTVPEVLEAGGIGVAVGRNVWQDEHPLEISKRLHGMIFK